MAVLLTYFAITTSYIPVAVYHYVKEHPSKKERQQRDRPASINPARTRENRCLRERWL
jgi:hypothetical protein